MPQTLLIGGAGFIGTALIRQLGPENVAVFDNLSSIVHDRNSINAFMKLGADFLAGDIASPFDVDQLLDQGCPKTVVYLAAETGTGRSLQNCTLNARVNTLGLSIFLDALSARGMTPERFVLTSTRAVYGEGPYQHTKSGETSYPSLRSKSDLDSENFDFPDLEPLAENAALHPAAPVNIYGSTKLSQENILSSWATAFEVPLHVFRLQNVYGAGQSLINPYTGVLIHFIKQAMAREDILIYENGGITRDFVHVDDVARLLALAITGKGPVGLFDCGSGVRADLYDVAQILLDASSGGKPKYCADYRLGDVRHACADIDQTKTAFDWTPQVALDEGMRDLSKAVQVLLG